MGGICSMHGDINVYGCNVSVRKTEGNRPLEYLEVDGRIILKRIL
jgi:hypothetical protein